MGFTRRIRYGRDEGDELEVDAVWEDDQGILSDAVGVTTAGLRLTVRKWLKELAGREHTFTSKPSEAK